MQDTQRDETQGLIDMTAVADRISAAGFYAYVEQTGGGCATIYAYRATEHHSGEPDVMAGPGTFDWTGGQHAGYRGDFAIGRTSIDAARMEWGEDDYATDVVYIENESDEAIADVIVQQLRNATVAFGARS